MEDDNDDDDDVDGENKMERDDRPMGLGNARIGTVGPQEELVSRTNEPETINNIACVRAEKAKVDNAATRARPFKRSPIRDSM